MQYPVTSYILANCPLVSCIFEDDSDEGVPIKKGVFSGTRRTIRITADIVVTFRGLSFACRTVAGQMNNF